MKTNTPETDAQANLTGAGGPPTWHLHADFARKLERERDEARHLLIRIARKGEFMDREGLRLTVQDWLAYRHISSENSQADRPNGSV